ncbi:uncharacterized protein LOC130625939 [Hydractinia symbiolongicarpus]|uniref:uncharacterized protein LOC130625939 n=1 Tax=Hydractinia symbiolongicarpus TaxID=13093 RepID=UPI00254F1B9C|nr:uncharacterized protein LOC130625939 [Hydractinia symbiolongicarpus]
MAFKVFTLILLLFAIKYILTEDKLYLIHSVNDIKNGKIIKHSKGFTRTTCLLKCRNNQDCDTAYFKSDQGNNAIGECWFVQEGGEDELQLPETSGEVESFKGVPDYCEKDKPCKDGRYKSTDDRTQNKTDVKTQNETHINDSHWKLLTKKAVCFGAKDNKYGRFTLYRTGLLTKLKLQHAGPATLNCRTDLSNIGSRWGCSNFKDVLIMTAVTDKNNSIIIPGPERFTTPKKEQYKLPGYHANSSYLEFGNLNRSVEHGEELRIWYLHDLYNVFEGDNAGSSCAVVYAVIQDFENTPEI